MKKLSLMLCITATAACSFMLLSFIKPIKNAGNAALPSNGTLYIKIKSDGNKGNIHVSVRSASSVTKLVDVQLAPGQSVEKTLTGLQNGPQSCYLVTFDWPQGEFHNMSASAGNTIAWGVPVTANNAVLSWQIGGYGAFGSIPVFLP